MPLLSAIVMASAAAPVTSISTREEDWRVGPVVYQVLVDRFAPPKDLNSKRAMFRPPRVLRNWKDLPVAGKLIQGLNLYSHDLAFWGGDFSSLDGKLDYVSKLGVDVLSLDPIEKATSNHKNDPEDLGQIDPQFGTKKEFDTLVDDVHSSKMRLILNGVFDHVARNSAIFLDASSAPTSKRREWFVFDKSFDSGYRTTAGAPTYPSLHLENPEVRNYLWSSPDSVAQKFLRDGADGWKVGGGFELGPDFLYDFTKAAHKLKPDSDIVADVSGYPSDWFPAVDGVLDTNSISLVEQMLDGKISGGRTGLALNHLVLDAGIEHLLRSWLPTDGQEGVRLATKAPDVATRKLIWAMQMTLPGSPVIYYGSELGMEGGAAPENRAPMRWDLATDQNANLTWVQKMLRVRKATPALRYGDFLALDTSELLAYVRTTDKVLESRLVIVNPTKTAIEESFSTRVGRMLGGGRLTDVLTGESIRTVDGMVTVKIPPKTVRIYAVDAEAANGYSPYHRIP